MQPANAARRGVTLFLCGDVMTGRGIDQILGHPSKPHLREHYVRSALEYVEIAERASGPIARPAKPDYIWGDALAELERVRPDARIINLETGVTTSEDAWPGKGIHYRMHPANASCLTGRGDRLLRLANNHVLDWGYAGAGRDARHAARSGHSDGRCGPRRGGGGRAGDDRAVRWRPGGRVRVRHGECRCAGGLGGRRRTCGGKPAARSLRADSGAHRAIRCAR